MDFVVAGNLSAPAKVADLLSEKEMELLKRTGEPKSASQLARELGWSEQLVIYYIKKLMKRGCIEVSHKDISGNTVATFYRRSAEAFYVAPGSFRKVRRRVLSRKYVMVVGSPRPHGPFMSASRDMVASSIVAMKLGQMFGRGKVIYDIVFGPHLEEGSIYVIGGPRANRAYSRYPFPKFRERTFRVKGRSFSSPFHGIICSREKGGKQFICIAGNTSHGTLAAAIAFSDDSIFRSVHSEEACIVVSGKDEDGDGLVDGFSVVG